MILKGARQFIEDLTLVANMVQVPGICIHESVISNVTSLPQERVDEIIRRFEGTRILSTLQTRDGRVFMLPTQIHETTCLEFARALGHLSEEPMVFWSSIADGLRGSAADDDPVADLLQSSREAFSDGLAEVMIGDLIPLVRGSTPAPSGEV